MRKAALGVKQCAAIAIDRERDGRIGKTCSVPVEIKESIGKGVRHRIVQRLIGIGHVDGALDQPGSEVFCRLAMTVKFQFPVPRLAPAIGLAAITICPGLELEIWVVAQQAKRWNDVLAEILVL